MKSSFELGGYEKGEENVKATPRKTKAVTNPITGDLYGHLFYKYDNNKACVDHAVVKFEDITRLIFKQQALLWATMARRLL